MFKQVLAGNFKYYLYLIFQNFKLLMDVLCLIVLLVFVCGGLGYENFIQFSILSRILSWQQPSGCFISSGPVGEKSKHRNTKIMFHERHPLVERRHAGKVVKFRIFSI